MSEVCWYHVSRDGQVFGPYDPDTLKKHFSDGLIVASDMVTEVGAAEWKRVDACPELFGMSTAGPPPPPPPAAGNQPAGPVRSVHPWRSPFGIGIANIICMCLESALYLLSDTFTLAYVEDYDSTYGFSQSGEIYSTLDDILLLVSMPVSLVTGVVFIIWFYRAYANLSCLGRRASHGRVWTIWGWFVPFYSLYKPGAIGVDLERESSIAAGDAGSTALSRWWWGLWLLFSFLSWTYYVCVNHWWSYESVSAGPVVAVSCLSMFVDTALPIVATFFVLKVNRCQKRAAMELGLLA